VLEPLDGVKKETERENKMKEILNNLESERLPHKKAAIAI